MGVKYLLGTMFPIIAGITGFLFLQNSRTRSYTFTAYAIYGNEATHIAGMTFGPFTQLWSVAQGVLYFGARNTSVWSYTRVVEPSTRLLLESVNKSLIYNTAVPSELVAAVDAPAAEDNYIELQESSSELEATTMTEVPVS